MSASIDQTHNNVTSSYTSYVSYLEEEEEEEDIITFDWGRSETVFL